MPDMTFSKLTSGGRMVAFLAEGAEPSTSGADDDFQSYRVTPEPGSEFIIKALSEDYARELARGRYGRDVPIEKV